jgi:hypothetical protein
MYMHDLMNFTQDPQHLKPRQRSYVSVNTTGEPSFQVFSMPPAAWRPSINVLPVSSSSMKIKIMMHRRKCV